MAELWVPEQPNKGEPCLFKLSEPNAKINHWAFNLPAGFTCPEADKCLSKADRVTGKITDAPEIDFRCYSTSQEARLPKLRKSRWNNFDALRSLRTSENMAKALVATIEQRLPRSEKILRLHDGGDFFSKTYMDAWVMVANRITDVLFYGYTKSVKFLLATMPLPRNLRLTVSLGGKNDALAMARGLKHSIVVFSEEEAANYRWVDENGKEHIGVEIDHDDTHAYKDNKPFALLVHGNQPAGSAARAALNKLGGISGKSSYGKGRKSLPTVESFRQYINRQWWDK